MLTDSAETFTKCYDYCIAQGTRQIAPPQLTRSLQRAHSCVLLVVLRRIFSPRRFGEIAAVLAFLLSVTIREHFERVEAAGPVSEIASAGPLERIYVDAQLACQFGRAGDPDLAFFDPASIPGDCGTFLAVDGVLFAPSLKAGAAGSLGDFTTFSPVSQTAVSGSGTNQDPFVIVTTVSAGTSGLRIVETDAYVVGEESYRTDIAVLNTGLEPRAFKLYRAADCYAAGSDLGYGYADRGTGAVACAKNPNNLPSGRVEQFSPSTPADHFFEAYFDHVWTAIGRQATLPDTCTCDTLFDNAIAVSWERSLEVGESLTVSVVTSVAAPPPPAPPPPPVLEVVPPPPPPQPAEPPADSPTEEHPPVEEPPALAVASVVTTIIDNTGAEASVVSVGTTVHPRVVVAGSSGTPTGSIQLSWFTNPSCNGAPSATSPSLTLTVGGSGAAALDAPSFSQTPSAAGGYSFLAMYSGDTRYSSANAPCASLQVDAGSLCDDRGDGDDEHNVNKNLGKGKCDGERGHRHSQHQEPPRDADRPHHDDDHDSTSHPRDGHGGGVHDDRDERDDGRDRDEHDSRDTPGDHSGVDSHEGREERGSQHEEHDGDDRHR